MRETGAPFLGSLLNGSDHSLRQTGYDDAGSALWHGGLMDRQALKRRLRPKVDAALDKALDAVQAAPDGQWISGSEWAVRGRSKS